MQKILDILDIIGYVSTVVVIISAVLVVSYSIRGFLPVLVRLGNGLWKRQIAVFAKGDNINELKSLLKDSKLFRSTNTIEVPSLSSIGSAEVASIFLINWPDWSEDIKEILRKKKDQTAMIIYAPKKHGPIPPEIIDELETHRNVVVNNFRGRLLNDIVTAMITTSYDKDR